MKEGAIILTICGLMSFALVAYYVVTPHVSLIRPVHDKLDVALKALEGIAEINYSSSREGQIVDEALAKIRGEK